VAKSGQTLTLTIHIH